MALSLAFNRTGSLPSVQMTRITRERGALVHDDRLDVLSMAVAYWVEQMSADVDREMKTRKDELLDKELEKFMQNAISVNKFTEVEPKWFSI